MMFYAAPTGPRCRSGFPYTVRTAFKVGLAERPAAYCRRGNVSESTEMFWNRKRPSGDGLTRNVSDRLHGYIPAYTDPRQYVGRRGALFCLQGKRKKVFGA